MLISFTTENVVMNESFMIAIKYERKGQLNDENLISDKVKNESNHSIKENQN